MHKNLLAISITALLIFFVLSACNNIKTQSQATGTKQNTEINTTNDSHSTGGNKVSLGEKIYGINCRDASDINTTTLQYLKNANIGYVKLYVPYPFVSADNDTLASEYTVVRDKIILLSQKGIKVLAQTFIPGSNSYNSATGKIEFRYTVPDSTGFNSKFYAGCKRGCDYIGGDLGQYVDMWLIANELNSATFTGSMSNTQISDFVSVCSSSIKKTSPGTVCGINLFAAASNCNTFVDLLFKDGTNLDFIGFDGYFGSLTEGSPETWRSILKLFTSKYDIPVFITEFSYSTAVYGLADYSPDSGKIYNTEICKYKKLPFDWNDHERNRSTQAEYLKDCLDIFDSYENVMGCFWWCLKDYSGPCFECGDKNCPMDAGWGLLTVGNGMKPSLKAYTEYIKNKSK